MVVDQDKLLSAAAVLEPRVSCSRRATAASPTVVQPINGIRSTCSFRPPRYPAEDPPTSGYQFGRQVPLQDGRQVPLSWIYIVLPKAELLRYCCGLGRERATPLQSWSTRRASTTSSSGYSTGCWCSSPSNCRSLVLELYVKATLKASVIRTEQTCAVVR